MRRRRTGVGPDLGLGAGRATRWRRPPVNEGPENKRCGLSAGHVEHRWSDGRNVWLCPGGFPVHE